MLSVEKLGKTDEYVYDVSLDETVVNALGMNIMSNTDGFNFQLPLSYRYTEDNPYISTGEGRNTEKGKAYVGVEADVAEFEDIYLNKAYNGGINKMGLGIDEFADATINFSRKNYADLLPGGKIKLVGNSIKSKKMPLYIEKFLNEGIKLLLYGKGKEFLESYYDYIEKIYNLQIPLKEIASVGKIKISLDNYKSNCKELTAGGTKKARQAWYELAIKHHMNVNMGDTIYYINTGVKKNDSDVQRITKYYLVTEDSKEDITKELTKRYNAAKKKDPMSVMNFAKGERVSLTLKEWGEREFKGKIIDEDEVVFNCTLLPSDILEDDEDHFCDDNFEYNVAKYITMFNKRIRPLLVCFSEDIRYAVNEKGKVIDNILITHPNERKQFTEEESKLVAGQPYKPTDQDTYEQLMSIEDKEIKFWLSVNKIPPFVEECGINWNEVVEDYKTRQKELEREEIQHDIRMYNEVISKLTKADVESFIEDGTLPDKLLKIVDEDTSTMNFVSKKYNVVIGTIFDIIDKEFVDTTDD